MATNALPANWWQGTQFDQGGQFGVPGGLTIQASGQTGPKDQYGNYIGAYGGPQTMYSIAGQNAGNRDFYNAYFNGGRTVDAPIRNPDGSYTIASEMTPQQRVQSGLNNGRIFLNATADPKTGALTFDPNSMRVGEAAQNASMDQFWGRGAVAAALGAAGGYMAGAGSGADAAGGLAGAGGELGGTGSSVGGSLGGVGGGVSDTGAFGAAGGGALSGGGGASTADVGYMGPGSAGAGATGEVGAAAPEASGSLLSQLTPQQIASAVQQYGPTAIKALGMIAASTAAQHAANSQNSSGSSSNAAGVAPWNYQQQPIAPGSAFGGGMFGQQQGNPMGMQAPQAISPQQRAAWSQQFLTGDPTGGMRGYQFGNMGGPGKQPQMMPPQQGQSPQNPYMPQGFGGMMGGPSQQAMQQYQQQLFQQRSGPGGFYGFQAPVAQQQMPQQALSQQMPSSPLYNNNGPQMPQVPQYMPRANIQPGMVSQPVSGGSTPQQWWGNLPSGLFGRVT